MRPPSLRIFQITSSRPAKEAKRIVEYTFDAVVIDVKLGKHKFGGAKTVLADLHEWWKLGHTLGKVSRPLATNVVRDSEGEREGADEGREDNEVHVSIAVRRYDEVLPPTMCV
jgi:hypothetical protein